MGAPDDRSATILHPASGALILGLDWLLFSQNAMTLGLSTPLVALVGFGLAGLGTSLIQRIYRDDSLGKSVLKGLGGGIAVGIPLPIAGTAVGGGILALSGLNRLWGRSDSENMPSPHSESDR